MPTVEIKDQKNQKVGSLELPDAIFAYPYKQHLVHEAVRNYRAGLRAGTHKVKNRSEVAGSGKKPFKQKGTGRARQGGNRPPIHRHGGTVFGPVVRDHSYKMNAKEKKNALKAALSFKVKDGKLILVNQLTLAEPKTKLLIEQFGKIGAEGKTLLIDSLENVNLVLASRNLPKVQMVDPLNVNVYDVVNSRYIVVTESAMRKLTEVLGS
ncbi:MAG: 50S ribosomal protein L4 [Thermoanaerobaculia bacterium]